MAFFMFQFMYLQILLLAYAVADGVYWNLSTTPAIFGHTIKLTCHLEEISTNPTECAERKWIVDPGNKVLTNGGVSSENRKYTEVKSLHNPTFDLEIMNLAESDVNVDYTCTCGYESFSKKLVLKEERFHYPPIGTNTHFFVHNGLLKVTVQMPKVYPVPNCSLMVGDNFIQSKAVMYSQNGIVYTVDFNAEYKFREKDCNKKPIVVCTFGMVSGPVRFEGDDTYKCLNIPRVRTNTYDIPRVRTNTYVSEFDRLTDDDIKAIKTYFYFWVTVFFIGMSVIIYQCFQLIRNKIRDANRQYKKENINHMENKSLLP